ncbi:peptidoglycan recognition family protein [Elusimicrobiota bacterium]
MRKHFAAIFATVFVFLFAGRNIAKAFLLHDLPFKVITREEWGARPQNAEDPLHYCYNYLNHREHFGITETEGDEEMLRKIYADRRIIIHHTGVSQGRGPLGEQMAQMDELGWFDIAYHLYITPDGKIHEGRNLFIMGTQTGNPGHHDRNCARRKSFILSEDWDFRNIGIALEGDYQENPNIPEPQLKSLEELVSVLRDRLRISKVNWHKQFSRSRDCPGRYLIPKIKAMFPDYDKVSPYVSGSRKLNKDTPKYRCNCRSGK